MTGPSESYYRALEATQELHATTKKFNGRFLWRYLDGLKPLIDEYGCKTLLDYGCGKGVQWTTPLDNGNFLAKDLGVVATLYDPGWSHFAAEPEGQFDIVVCTQVLGSVPIADLPWVLDRIIGFATKAVFIGERVRDRPIRKQHLAHMADEMPHGWSQEQWAEAIRARPNPSQLPIVLQCGHHIEVIR